MTSELFRAGQVNPLAGADWSCCRGSPRVSVDRDDDGRSEPHGEAASSGGIRREDRVGGHGDDRAGTAWDGWVDLFGTTVKEGEELQQRLELRIARHERGRAAVGRLDARRIACCEDGSGNRAGDRRGAIEGTGGVAGGRVSITTERRPCRGGRNCRTWSSSPRAELGQWILRRSSPGT